MERLARGFSLSGKEVPQLETLGETFLNNPVTVAVTGEGTMSNVNL